MKFAQWVGEQFAKGRKFNSIPEAEAAYAAAGVCNHNQTCCGQCIECGYVIRLEGTFKVNPDKSRYLDARRS